MIEIFDLRSSGELIIRDVAKNLFSIVEDPENADWIIIPAFISGLANEAGWNLILINHRLAQSLNKPFGVFSNSDLIIDPKVKNLHLFTPGAYSSFEDQIELPAIIPYDPIDRLFKGEWSYTKNLSIGFCGQATRHPLKLIKDFYHIESMRFKKKRGKSPYLLIPRFMPAFERGNLLRHLEKSTLVKKNFILRSHYKAGASTEIENDKVEQEFYQNIKDNLFTLCIRGMGNYSVRFYQTLAMGRIPILIDTESVLPFVNQIDYNKLILKVPYAERFKVDNYVLDYLLNKSDDDLIAIQHQCRQIWLENFRTEGLLNNLSIIFKTVKSTPKEKLVR